MKALQVEEAWNVTSTFSLTTDVAHAIQIFVPREVYSRLLLCKAPSAPWRALFSQVQNWAVATPEG